MTRRLLAAALLASTLGGLAVATTAHAAKDGNIICIGGDDSQHPGRMIGYCIPEDILKPLKS